MAKILISPIHYATLQEALATQHMNKRLLSRLHELNLSTSFIQNVMNKLQVILHKNYYPDISYAIRLATFLPDKKSPNYIEIDERPYYKHRDEMGKVSIGDEFWAIVRDNKIVTFLLRKSQETEMGEDYLESLLNVDVVEI